MAINTICILWILLSCNYSNKEYLNKTNEIISSSDSLTVYSNQWKQDRFGCKKLRSIVIFENLLNGYSFHQKNKDEIFKILGQPNEEEKYEDKKIEVYFFNSICQNDTLIKQSDKSSIRLKFNKKNSFIGYDTRIE